MLAGLHADPGVCHQSNERKEPMVTENRNHPQPNARTQVFTLRLWQEQVNGGHWEWRGRVQNVMSGEVRYFREWGMLVELLQAMLSSNGYNSYCRNRD